MTEPRAIGGHDSAYASNATLAPDARGVVELFRYTKSGDGIRVIGPHDFCAMRGEANIEDGDHCTVSSGGNGYWQIHVDGGTCYVQCFDLY